MQCKDTKSQKGISTTRMARAVLAYVSPDVLQINVIVRRFPFLVLILATK